MADKDYESQKELRRLARVEIGKLLSPFDMYGMGVIIPQTSMKLMEVVERFHKEMSDGN